MVQKGPSNRLKKSVVTGQLKTGHSKNVYAHQVSWRKQAIFQLLFVW
jgi:hypothetical protein